jgi:hypothetical protein
MIATLVREEIEGDEFWDDAWLDEPADPMLALALEEELDKLASQKVLSFDTPSQFVTTCIKFREGDWPTPYQLRIIDKFWEHGRVAVTGPRGMGKSTMASWVVIFCWLRWVAVGIDWKIVTTAGSYRQLRFLWREVRKWAKLIDWEKTGLPESTGRQLQTMGIRTPDGESEALAASPADSGKIEGAHGTAVLMLVDEAKLVPDSTWDSIEGTFTNKARNEHGRQMIFAISTPGDIFGRFADIHHGVPGYEDWKALRVTLAEAIEAGQIDPDFVVRRKRQWGETSTLFKNQILGEFVASDEDGAIPMSWIVDAMARWTEMQDEGILVPLAFPPSADVSTRRDKGICWGIPETPDALGVDVGDTGPDPSVIVARWGNVASTPLIWARGDSLDTAEQAWNVAHLWHMDDGRPLPRIVVDAIGVGSGTYGWLKRKKAKVMAFIASQAAKRTSGRKKPYTDKSGAITFENRRAHAWWNFRELLNPENEEELALPQDPELLRELAAPKYEERAQGRIKIESKDDVRERLGGRSTNKADAIIQCWYPWENQRLGTPDVLPSVTVMLPAVVSEPDPFAPTIPYG